MWFELIIMLRRVDTCTYSSLDNTESDPWENMERCNRKTRDDVKRELIVGGLKNFPMHSRIRRLNHRRNEAYFC
jgi:hypothetical protein